MTLTQRYNLSDDNGYQTTITVVVMLTIVLIAVLLRIVTRKLLHQPLWTDDYLIFAAAVCSPS